MQKYLDALCRCPLFSGIAPTDLPALFACLGVRIQSYGKGAALLQEGESASHFGIVLAGSVQIEQTDYFGNRAIVGTAQTSELFGETFACAGETQVPVNVIARESCTVAYVQPKRLMQTCQNACDFHQTLLLNLLQVIAQKTLWLNRKIRITSQRTTREKLLAYLHTLAKAQGQQEVSVPYDRQGLADFLGVDRSGLSAEIGKLTKENVLSCRKNRFTLL